MILVIQRSITLKTTINRAHVDTCAPPNLINFLFQVISILRVTIMTRRISVEDIIKIAPKESESSLFYRSITDKSSENILQLLCSTFINRLQWSNCNEGLFSKTEIKESWGSKRRIYQSIWRVNWTPLLPSLLWTSEHFSMLF